MRITLQILRDILKASCRENQSFGNDTQNNKRNFKVITAAILVLLFLSGSVFAQTSTFDFESSTTGNASTTVTHTVSGVTLTVTSAENFNILDGFGYGGTSGIVLIHDEGVGPVTQDNFTISSPVNITSLRYVRNSGANAATATFSVVTGSGSNVVVASPNVGEGKDVILNWTNVTEFKVVYSAPHAPIYDNIVFTPAAGADSDGALTASGTISEPVALPTTATSTGTEVGVLDFIITDGGTSDGSALEFSQIVLHTSGTGNFSKVTWRLFGNGVSNVTGTYNSGTNTITFSSLSGSVADNDSERYTVYAYYNNPTGLTEGQTFILSIDGDTDVTTSGTTEMASSQTPVTNGTGSTVDITATKLYVSTSPADASVVDGTDEVVSGKVWATQPVVQATDASNNVDTDVTDVITISKNYGSGSLSGILTETAVNGVADFSGNGITYTATADGEGFALHVDDQAGVGSDLPQGSSTALSADVVATKLIFDTQPAPLSLQNNVATSFTTVPVVKAFDADDLIDTDYNTAIVISEVNGAGSAALSGTVDDDGDAATVTITPSSGAATFTGLQATYTASGGSSETFNLRASSGGLTTADSDQLTAVVNNAPTASNVSFSGTLEVGQTLTGSYTYNDTDSDPESGSTYKWYRSDDGSGSNKTAISGATSLTYELTVNDNGKYISFEVTPNDGSDAGSAVESSLQGAVSLPGNYGLVFEISAPSSSSTELTVSGSGFITTNSKGNSWSTDNGFNQLFGNSSFQYVNSNINFQTFGLTGNLQLSDGVTPISFSGIVMDDDNTGSDYDDFALNVNTAYTTAVNTNYTLSGSATFTLTGGATFADLYTGTFDGTFEGGQSGFGNFNIDDITIIVSLSNAAPTASNAPASVTVTEDVATALNLSAVSVADSDGDDITLTLGVNSGTIASTDGNGTFTGVTVAGTGTASMSLAGTAANINTYLDNTSKINFTTAANATSDVTLTLTPNDGKADGSAATVTLSVTAINDDPTLTSLPTDVTVTEDVASNVDLSSATFGDVDAGSSNVTLKIEAGAGTLAASSGGSVTVSGTGTAILTLSGTAANIETFLNTASNIKYTGESNVNGSDATTLTITGNDGNNTGSGGGNDISFGTVNVDITAVNDAPTLTDISKTINEDNTQTFAQSDFTGAYSDVDGDALNKIKITSLPSHGTLTLSGAAVSANDEIASASLGNLVYEPRMNYNGSDSFGYNAYDGTSYASTAKSVNITISAVNDAPIAGSGKALDFDGSNDYVLVQDAASLHMSSAFTLEAWVYVAGGQGTLRHVLGRLGSTTDAPRFAYSLRATNANQWQIYCDGVSIGHGWSVTGGTVTTGEWHHIAATYDNPTIKLYVDGVEVANGSDADVPGTDSYNLYIGSSQIGYPFNGKIDEVRLWNSARSQTDIQNNMYKPLAGSESGLAAYYHLDEGSGSTVLDATSNENDGTLTNMDPGSDWVESDAWKNRTIDEDNNLVINIEGYDPDGTALGTSTQVSAPSNGSLSFGPVTYSPTANYNGSDAFTYRVTDGTLTDDFAVSVNINSVNDKPTILIIGKRVDEDNTLTFAGTDFTGAYSDVENTALNKVKITSLPGHGTLKLGANTVTANDEILAANLGNLSYEPDGNYYGNDNFNYNSSDGTDYATSEAAVYITVIRINDDPTLTGLPTDVIVTEDVAGNVDLSSATFGDVDAGPYSVTLKIEAGAGTISASSGGSVTVSGTGTAILTLSGPAANIETFLNTASNIKYTGESNVNGSDATTLTITGNDGGNIGSGGGNDISFGTVSVNITAVNDPPVVTNVFGDNTSEVIAGAGATNITDLDDATVTNVDSPDYNGGSLIISQSIGTTNGSFGVDGTTVTSGGDGTIAAGETVAIDGTSIGTVHATNDGQGGNTFQIDFNSANATSANIQALIRSLTYSAPNGLDARTFTLTLNDNDGTLNGGDQDASGNLIITVKPNPPVIANLDGDNTSIPVGGTTGNIDVDDNSTVTDADNTNFNGGSLTIVQNTGTQNGSFSVDGTTVTSDGDATIAASETVSIGGTAVGTIDAAKDGQSGNTLLIQLNVEATPARTQALLRSLKYAAPSGVGDREFTITLRDAATNVGSTTADITISITPPEIGLKQGTTAIADGGSYDYGTHSLNSNTDITFTIENTGPGSLILSPLSISGADAGQFSIQQQPSTTVATSSSTTFKVRFTPTSSGTKTAAIAIANNDLDEDPYNLTLNGSGNFPPTTSDNTVNPNEGDLFTFATSDFPYSDNDSDPMVGIEITTLPAAGTLFLDLNDNDTDNGGGESITAGDDITKANLDANRLKYMPSAATSSGFTFKVSDGPAKSATSTMTLTVNAKPTVEITQAAGQDDPSNNSSISFKAVFNEAVTGFAATDVTLSGTSGATSKVTNEIAPNDGTTYEIAVTGMTTDGTVIVSIPAGAASDAGGATSKASTNTDNSVTYDATAPSGYTVTIDQSVINPTNENTVSFTFAGAEVGAAYDYTLSSSQGGTDVTGNGTIATATDQITGIDISGLNDGTITLSVTLRDPAGNTGNAATDTKTKDTVPPTVSITSTETSPTNTNPFSVTITFSESVNGFTVGDIGVGNGSVSNFSGSGTTYTADISPSADGAVTVDVAANKAQDGALNGNTAAAQYLIIYDSTNPTGYSVSIDQTVINPGNETAVSFTFAGAEVGAIYNYTFTGGGSSVTGTGTIASATDQITGIDLSSLGDGTITLSATLTDAAGNIGAAATDSKTKDVTGPTVSITSGESGLSNKSSFGITITFSEEVTGFSVGDFSITNGAVLHLQGAGDTYTADITPAKDGNVSVSIVSKGAWDDAGNGNIASEPFEINYDGTKPTVSVISAENTNTNKSPFVLTFVFSEPVTGLSLDDIVVGNGSASNLTGAGNNYNASITPASDGTVTVNIASNSAMDAAGNGNTALSQFSINYDGTRPRVGVTSAESGLINISPFKVTITFTEPVTGFSIGDISVVNGSAVNLVGSGKNYTADITPASDGMVTVDVPANIAFDASGNGNIGATQGSGGDGGSPENPFSLNYDGTKPSVEITSSENGSTNNSMFGVTIKFSEPVTGFALDAITVGNGSAGNLAGSGTTYTADITPASDGTVTMDVAANAAKDAAGNANTAAAQLAIDYDGTPPTLAITSTESGLTNKSPFEVKITFSEPVVGFTTEDIIVNNGTAGNFTGSGDAYTAFITPASDGTVTVEIGSDAAQDTKGNGNIGGSQFSTNYDGTEPTVQITASENGSTNKSPFEVKITFSEPVNGFTINDLIVGNGSASNFAGSGNTYTADIIPVTDGVVTVDVAEGASNDAAGNGNAAATQFSIMYDITAPTAQITSTQSNPTNASPFSVTFKFSESVTGFTVGDIVVGNGSAANLTGSGDTYTADITPVTDGAVTVDLEADIVQDAAGNGNTAFAQFSITYDKSAPTVEISSNADSPTNQSTVKITITFSEAVQDFELNDVVLTNASGSNFTALSSLEYQFDITPQVDGIISVSVPENACTDLGSNGNEASGTMQLLYDSTPPSVQITTDAESVTGNKTANITIAFSEPVVGFSSEDLTLGNAQLISFSQSAVTTEYTAQIEVLSGGEVTVNVSEEISQDAAGNANIAAEELSFVYNVLPVISISANTEVEYTEGGTGVGLFDGLNITDTDDSNLTGAVISISANFNASEDRLDHTGISGSAISVDASVAGVIKFTGIATIQQYVDAISRIKYINENDLNPTSSVRTVILSVNDDIGSSNEVNNTVRIILQNDPPEVFASGTGNLEFTEDGDAAILDNGLEVKDFDNTTLQHAEVSISSNYQATEDRFDAVTIQKIIADFDTNTGTLTLTGEATISEYQSVLRSVGYRNTSDNPNTSDRQVSIVVNDGNLNSNALTRTIEVNAVNDVPVVTSLESDTLQFTESENPVPVTGTAAVSDPDNTTLTGMTIAISSGYILGEDILEVTGNEEINGSFNSSSGIMSLSGTASHQSYIDVLRSVTYLNTSTDPSTEIRQITISANDGEGGSLPVVRTMKVIPINNLPEFVQGGVPDQEFDEDGGTIVTLSDFVSDLDNSTQEINFSAAVLSAGSNSTGSGGEVLNAGKKSKSTLSDLMIKIDNEEKSAEISCAPDSNGVFRVEITATDINGGSTRDTIEVTVTPVNDAPVLTAIPSVEFPEDSSFTLDLTQFVHDPDNSMSEITWTVTIQEGSMVPTAVNQRSTDGSSKKSISKNQQVVAQGTTMSGIGDQVQVLSDSITIEIDQANNMVTFSGAENFNMANIPLEITASDGLLQSNVESTDVSVLPVNDPPQIVAPLAPLEYPEDEEIKLLFTDLYQYVSDPDNTDDELMFSFSYTGGNLAIESITDEAITISPNKNWFGIDTVTVFVSDGELTTQSILDFSILSVNDLPAFISLADTVEACGSEFIDLDLWDAVDDVETPDENLTFEFTSSSDTLSMSYESTTGILTLSTPGSFGGKIELTIKVNDADGGSDSASTIYSTCVITSLEALEGLVPEDYTLEQNYPNPFNPTTTIRYGLPEESNVKIMIYNLLGELVTTLTDGVKKAGYYEDIFDAGRLATGIYLVSIYSESTMGQRKYTTVKKMMLVK